VDGISSQFELLSKGLEVDGIIDVSDVVQVALESLFLNFSQQVVLSGFNILSELRPDVHGCEVFVALSPVTLL